MQRVWDVSRREFLGLLGATGWFCASKPPTPGPGAPPKASAVSYKVLKPAQAEALEAIAEQIIPAGRDPGARELGAVRYIDNVLAGYQSEKLPLYVAGLEGTDQTSQLLYGWQFAKLSFDQQTGVLKSVERGTAQGEVWCSASCQEFFAMVWGHVLEGFYGPPKHGGNKNYASWKMVGFPEHSGTM